MINFIKRNWLIISIIILASFLRLWSLDKYPAGLNADEAAIGYNAYSLIQTGKDEHGVSWPLVFRSFDDYKPPLYFYLVLPFIKIFGLNVWSVRLPSALLGIFSVYLIFLITKLLFVIPGSTRNPYKYVPHLSALLLAISPWHLQFSRGGWEVNAALFFILLGIYGFLRGLEKPKYFFVFVISLALSLYAYHSARIISPLLALSLIVIYWNNITPSFRAKSRNLIIVIPDLIRNLYKSTQTRIFIIACTFGIILAIPLASQLLSKEGQSRFSGVSVFSDTGPLWQALEMRRQHPNETILVKALHNRYLSYGLRFTKNYLSHYSPRFLFITGDEIARSKVPGMGQTYLFLAPFYLIGLLALLKLETKGKIFIFIWFLVAPLAAALTFQSPHALRAQNMVVPLTIISALGLTVFLDLIQKFRPKFIYISLAVLLSAISFYSFTRYLHLYYVHYPKELSFAWQYGFDQISSYVKDHYDEYDHIIITDRYDQPYILLAFFLKYPPAQLQKELVMSDRDNFGFSTGRSFGKLQFHKINYDQDKKLVNSLIISADEPVDEGSVIYTIKDPAGRPMYKFISTKK